LNQENNNQYQDEDSESEYNDDESDESSESSNSSDSSDSNVSDDNNRPQNKKFKPNTSSKLQEEINDLKRDIINNSGSLDHVEMALETLEGISEDYPKATTLEIINKFKEEITKLNNLKSIPGSIKIKKGLFNKYKEAHEKVYDMIQKEYNKKKEKLNIKAWINRQMTKKKKSVGNSNNKDYSFSMMYPPQPFPKTFILPIDGWGGNAKPVKDQDLINEFDTLYKADTNSKTGTEYFKELNTKKKKEYIKKLKEIKKIDGVYDNKPSMAKIIECETTDNNKSIILSKINTFENLKGSSEYYKLKSWINKVQKFHLENIFRHRYQRQMVQTK
jgi:hypothetical protein